MKYITEWRQRDGKSASDRNKYAVSYYIYAEGPTIAVPRIAAKVICGSMASTWSYAICRANGGWLASMTGLPSFEEAKSSCEAELKQFGFEFLSDERIEKIRLLL